MERQQTKESRKEYGAAGYVRHGGRLERVDGEDRGREQGRHGSCPVSFSVGLEDLKQYEIDQERVAYMQRDVYRVPASDVVSPQGVVYCK